LWQPTRKVLVSFLRRISTSHLLLLCAGVVAVAIGGAALAIAAAGGGPTPPPKPLAAAIHDALAAPAPQGVTARVKFTNRLVDSVDIRGSNPLLTGATGRLWATPNGRIRIELQSSTGDAQIVSDGRIFWAYDGSSNTVYRGTLPRHREKARAERSHRVPTLAQIERAIARFGRHASLSGAIPSDVAGSAAYTVRAAPKRAGGLLGGIAVAWDPARGVPLRFALYAKGQSDPVLELKATDISYGPVPAGDFAISPPAGASTVDLTPRRARAAAPTHAAPTFKVVAPRKLAGRPRQEVRLLGSRRDDSAALVTYGRGLDGIAVLEQHAAAVRRAGPLDRAQLPSVTIGDVRAQELVTPLGTLIRCERGGVTYTVVGSVTRATAEAAARGL